MSPVDRPAEKPAEKKITRDRILEAALDLFASRGFQSTTVRDIAAAAGVNIALINYHFGSKEQLYKDLILARFSMMFVLLDRIVTDASLPPQEKVERLIGAYVDFVYANPDIPRLIVREMTLRSDIAIWFAQEVTSQVAVRIFPVIMEAREAGFIRRDVDISVLIPAFIGSIVFGVVAAPVIEAIQAGMGVPAIDIETRKREVKDVILNGVKSR